MSNGTNANDYFVTQVNDTVNQVNLQMGDAKAQDQEHYPCIDISSWMEPSGDQGKQRRVVAEIARL